ncbi:MAG TPA: L-aspartate oxidase [Terriglobales bacterium]|nr:L-aspartate oxidase [Terriglobales bacterium]
MKAEQKAAITDTDFVVVGAGVAGLRAAIELAAAGRVLVLAKLEVKESATQYAQGGIAAALSDEDEISLHLQDTLVAGDGLCNPQAARVLVEEGPERIEELIAWGTHFDRNGTKLAFTREGAHSRDRILHAHGDSTGQEIGRALYFKAKSIKNIVISEFEFALDLLVENGRVSGVKLLGEDGHPHTVRASAVLLATGGLGHVYKETTNPAVATGDGVAMAFRAGAEISDMEFVQFHPTALYVKGAPRFLLSEALRGEGAILRNDQLARFMPKYHPLAELAPRDVVARAIAHELELSRSKDPVVYLDLTDKNPEKIRQRFPRIYDTCLKYNVDITTDMIPVRPAAHYAMGGVKTDLDGCTSLAGLYAAGEVACTGVHGANRLASNSLLEGLVFGERAARSMRSELNHRQPAIHQNDLASTQEPASSDTRSADDLIREVQNILWRDVGIVRSGHTLMNAIHQLEALKPSLPTSNCRRCQEARNVWQTGILIAKSALAREESRGAHYRTDFPAHDDKKFLKHSVIAGDKIRFELLSCE